MAYSEKVMDHFANPRNVGKLEDASGVGEVGNAKCGDIMKMYIRVEDGISLAPYYERQMIWGAFGLIAMVACMSFDYRHLQAMALPFFLIVLFSLCLIPLFGKVIYGARRWIDLGLDPWLDAEAVFTDLSELREKHPGELDGDPLAY